MTQSTEIEKKILITKIQFEAIMNEYSQIKTITQTNYYFDTHDFSLRKHKTGLRVRIFKNQKSAEQTLKIPQQNPKTNHELIEITDQLPIKTAEKIISSKIPIFAGEVGKYLNLHFYNTDFLIFANATTKRTLLLGPLNTEITLDQTNYQDKSFDYELEIENNKAELINQVAVILQQKFQLNFDKQVTNKVERAFKHR